LRIEEIFLVSESHQGNAKEKLILFIIITWFFPNELVKEMSNRADLLTFDP
jgi:hypothetical protein